MIITIGSIIVIVAIITGAIIVSRRPISETDYDPARLRDADGKPRFPGTYLMRLGDARHRCTQCGGVLRTYADNYLGVCLACEEKERIA